MVVDGAVLYSEFIDNLPESGGTWEPDLTRFPNGLRAISDHALAKGVKTLVWFEPERVRRGTWLYENRAHWLLGCDDEARTREDGGSRGLGVEHAARAEEDVVAGLEAGADDYVTKPFKFAVLLARIRAQGYRVTAQGIGHREDAVRLAPGLQQFRGAPGNPRFRREQTPVFQPSPRSSAQKHNLCSNTITGSLPGRRFEDIPKRNF